MLERRLELLVRALELVHLCVMLFLVGCPPGFFFAVYMHVPHTHTRGGGGNAEGGGSETLD